MGMASHISAEYPSPNHDERVPTIEHDGGRDGERDDDDDPRASVLEPGVYVDRYRILDVVGTGGIGVVYAAFDEALGRNVALKLLRPNARNARKLERRRARLVREAQALARLSHPNVVPIYEVGMFEDRVFLSMEYIEGSTMRRWLRRTPRGWEEVLDKYLQAGRGLAAAHAADIVHRDFKPDNVLVGDDGRVRVLDFGLATPVPDALATGRFCTISLDDVPVRRTHANSPPPQLTESVSRLITAHGKVMGTPAYMAPEQGRGEPIDARADQYSFCVALWEALFGERPQGPPTATARIRLHRRLSEHGLTGKDVPQFITRALERGLSVDPSDRFESMSSLIEALSPPPSPWRRRLLVGVLPTAAAIAAIVGLLAADGGETCPREDAALVGVWDANVRDQLHARLTATDRSYASATWGTVARELDRWSKRWLDARVDACEDTKLRDEQSPVLFDMRMACLDRQLNALAAVTENLTAAPSEALGDVDALLESALSAVLELPDPERCERAALIGGGALLDEDPALDEQLEVQRQHLARARALLGAAELDEALALTDDVLEHAADAPDQSRVLVAEAKLIRGRILVAADELEQAEDDLRRAVFVAQTHGQDPVTVEACAALVDLQQQRGELDSAEDWAEIGRATLARIGGDPHLEASLRLASARLDFARGDLQAALIDQQRVIEIREQLYGSDHVEVAKALVELVRTKTALGAADTSAASLSRAEADIERALAILIREFGVTHPEVGLAYSHDAALLRARGAHDAALSRLLDALAVFEIAYERRHPRIVATYRAIAAIHLDLGHLEQALAALERARTTGEDLAEAGDAELAPTLIETAGVLHALERDDEAHAILDAARELILDAHGPQSPALADVARVRARIHADAGDLDAAREQLGEAIERLSVLGADDRLDAARAQLAALE